MNELLIMRHAKSDWSLGVADFDRPLNDRGRRAAARMGEWLVEEKLCPDTILSSPAARTSATVAAVVDACGLDTADSRGAYDAVVFDRDCYLAAATTWLQKLARQGTGRVLICGHNPGLDDLVEHLARRPVELSASGKLMTTAAVAHFELRGSWSTLDADGAALRRLVRPADLD